MTTVCKDIKILMYCYWVQLLVISLQIHHFYLLEQTSISISHFLKSRHVRHQGLP
jgi:hypothetical protein